MSKTVTWLMISMLLLVPIMPSYGQTPAEINSLLAKSKLVDSGRPVNTTLTANKVTISTYCDAAASNKDCKITALLMMKELRRHYKSIHSIRVLFYDSTNIHRERDVEIREGDVLLVDTGKPLEEVLSQIDVNERNLVATTNASTRAQSRTTVSASQQRSMQRPPNDRISLELCGYRSTDGTVSMDYPKNWIMESPESQMSLINVAIFKSNSKAYLSLSRCPQLPGISLEQLLEHQLETQRQYKSARPISRRSVNCHGLSGICMEQESELLQGIPATEKAAAFSGHKYVYLLSLYAVNMNDREMSSLFETMCNSLTIRD